MVSGPALATLGVGGLFAYGAISGKSPLQALGAVVKGGSPETAPTSTGIDVPELATSQQPALGMGGEGVVAAAAALQGTPYVWAMPHSKTDYPPKSCDCSGLTMVCYWHALKVTLPHFAAAQYTTLKHAPLSDAEPGDLIFYDHPHIGHVVIYDGQGGIWEAPHTGASVHHIPLYKTGIWKHVGKCPGNAREQYNPKGQASPYPPEKARALAQLHMGQFGWAGNTGYWQDLDLLWSRESGWSNVADTRQSGLDPTNAKVYAYGIPQARPASKYPKKGRPPDLGGEADPLTQILWGLRYIKSTYGNPTVAWAHETANGWY